MKSDVPRTFSIHDGHARKRRTEKRILLVDDSQTALLLTRTMLGAGPWRVEVARDGAEAIDKAIAARPDLILMDVVMPKMDGFEACRRIKASSATREVPVIMITTRGEGENVERGFSSGCSDYITKPVDRLELLTKVKSLLGD